MAARVPSPTSQGSRRLDSTSQISLLSPLFIIKRKFSSTPVKKFDELEMLANLITDNPARLHTSYIRSVGLAGAVVFFTLIILGEVSGLYSVSNFMQLQSQIISVINQTLRLEELLDAFISESADFVNDFNAIASQPARHTALEEVICVYGYKTLFTFLNTYDVMISNICQFLMHVHNITYHISSYIPGEQVSILQHIHERLMDLIIRAASSADIFRQIEEYMMDRHVPYTN